MGSLSILLIDSHQIFRSALKEILERRSVFSVFFEVDTTYDGMSVIEQNSVDIVLLSLNSSTLDGFSFMKELKRGRQLNNVKVIVLSIHSDPSLSRLFTELGVRGYLCREFGADDLFEAIDTVVNGGIFYPECDSEIKHLLYSGPIQAINLSKQEIEIIRLIAKGYTSKEMTSGYESSTCIQLNGAFAKKTG